MQTKPEFIELHAGNNTLRFSAVRLVFLSHGIINVFANKNNKTLRETLAHRRYQSLSQLILSQYRSSIDMPLGAFLLGLKNQGDAIYRRFLNPHGDKSYCHFKLDDDANSAKKGIYVYALNNQIAYIGRSYDPFVKRVDQGYGKIHPKNCYLDGQSTNCHLNALIAEQFDGISFHVCPLLDNHTIEESERFLIQQYKPKWNVALTR